MAHDDNLSERSDARDQIGAMLRAAMPDADEASLDDATRRLMLQLSIEPLEAVPQVQPVVAPKDRNRFFDRALRVLGA